MLPRTPWPVRGPKNGILGSIMILIGTTLCAGQDVGSLPRGEKPFAPERSVQRIPDPAVLRCPAAAPNWGKAVPSASSDESEQEGRAREQRSDTGEFLIDTSIAYVPEPSYQSNSAIAFDGSNYLVVWQDTRRAPNEYHIWGTRVHPDGRVLDPAGIPISPASGVQVLPAVAFDGANYLVVWGSAELWAPGDIYGARVTPDGVVLDSAGIAICTDAADQRNPAVASDGSNCLVVWEDVGSWDYSDIYGARVSPGGTVLDSAAIAISTAPYHQGAPAIAFDGVNYLVVWEDGRTWWRYPDVCGARVTPGGSVLDTAGIRLFPGMSPAVAFDGSGYLVVGEQPGDIYGVRVDPAGSVIDSAVIATSTNRPLQSPAIGFDGTNYLVL